MSLSEPNNFGCLNYEDVKNAQRVYQKFAGIYRDISMKIGLLITVEFKNIRNIKILRKGFLDYLFGVLEYCEIDLTKFKEFAYSISIENSNHTIWVCEILLLLKKISLVIDKNYGLYLGKLEVLDQLLEQKLHHSAIVCFNICEYQEKKSSFIAERKKYYEYAGFLHTAIKIILDGDQSFLLTFYEETFKLEIPIDLNWVADALHFDNCFWLNDAIPNLEYTQRVIYGYIYRLTGKIDELTYLLKSQGVY